MHVTRHWSRDKCHDRDNIYAIAMSNLHNIYCTYTTNMQKERIGYKFTPLFRLLGAFFSFALCSLLALQKMKINFNMG